MHKTLARQMRRYLGKTIEELPEQLRRFLKAVSDAYTHYDEGQNLLERSIDISSKELGDINAKLRQEIQIARDSQAQSKELEKINRFMVGREMRMRDLKKQIQELKRRNTLLEQQLSQHHNSSHTWHTQSNTTGSPSSPVSQQSSL